jgi:hypothetical protein
MAFLDCRVVGARPAPVSFRIAEITAGRAGRATQSFVCVISLLFMDCGRDARLPVPVKLLPRFRLV